MRNAAKHVPQLKCNMCGPRSALLSLFCVANVVSLVCLPGCGGGKETDPSPSGDSASLITSGGVAANVTVINGITVPPDPGKAGKSSLAGIDANANGVRDEVERELASFFGKSSATYSASIKFARKLQSPLSRSVTTSADALAAITDGLIAFECLSKDMDNEDDAYTVAQLVSERTFNTKNRIVERTRIYDLSGLWVLPNVGASSCE